MTHANFFACKLFGGHGLGRGAFPVEICEKGARGRGSEGPRFFSECSSRDASWAGVRMGSICEYLLPVRAEGARGGFVG